MSVRMMAISMPLNNMKLTGFEFITIGCIIAPWGVKGKLKVKVTTDFPQRFEPLSRVYVNQQPMTIDSAEQRKGELVIKLSTVDSIEAAQQLCERPIEIHRKQIYTLPKGQYYHFQLIGLKVWTTEGNLLGRITEIMTTTGNDNYVVKGDGKEILIPAIGDVVKSIDLDKGRVVIEAIPGLLSLIQKTSND